MESLRTSSRHILKSLASKLKYLALASNPTSPQKCPVRGTSSASRTSSRHILKFLALASSLTSSRKCTVLDSRTAFFFDSLKRKITKHKNLLNSGVGAVRIFDWGGGQSVNHRQCDVIKIFQKERFFMRQNALVW